MSARWLLLLTLTATSVGCLPDRLSTADEDTAKGPGGEADAAVDTEEDAGDTGAEEDVATTPEVGPKGCASDQDCSALVTSVCHEATCDQATGLCAVVTKANGTPCPGESKCLSDEVCTDGACVGKAVNCDDDNYCTTDSCTDAAGCINVNNELACTDGDPCTGPDSCSEGECSGQPVKCPSSSDPCYITACDPKAGGCVSAFAELSSPATVTCDDQDACTENDSCSEGACKGTPKKCEDDGDSCTMEVCLQGNCLSSPSMGMACDDGDVCTEMDVCGADPTNPVKAVCAGSKITCDDKNPCTDDACGKDGCAFTPNTKTCDDDDPCTSDSSCKEGKCVGGAKKSCDDGFSCTTDACDKAANGCVHTLKTGSCNDGDACTTDDLCLKTIQGATVCGGKKVDCDDKNPCTKDACVPGKGCVNNTLKNTTACKTGAGDDGICWSGGCQVPKCGNGSCEVNEDTASCVADCPAGGGACDVTDQTCLTKCQTDKCGVEDTACTAAVKCPATASCLEACTTDACRLKCIADNPPKAVAAYHALGFCLSTKCEKNDWNGKPCVGKSATASCIEACGAGVCPVEQLGCFGVPQCKAIVDCQAKCPISDNLCPVKCVSGQPKSAQDLFIVYDDCLSAKCK